MSPNYKPKSLFSTDYKGLHGVFCTHCNAVIYLDSILAYSLRGKQCPICGSEESIYWITPECQPRIPIG